MLCCASLRNGEDGEGMKSQFGKISLKRRFRWNQAVRSPLPPALMGLVTFSFVLVALGAAVYVSAVPSLIQQSPTVKQVTTAIEDSGFVDAVTGAFSNGGGFSEAEVNSSSVDFGGIGADGASFDAISPDGTPDDSANMDQPEQTPDQPSTPADPNQGTSGEDTGSNPGGEEQTGPSPDQEAAYHEALVQLYNELPQYENAVQSTIQLFNEQCLNPSSDERYASFQNTLGVFHDLGVQEAAVTNLRVPSNSRWYEAARGVDQLYVNLYEATALVQRSWLLNLPLDDPKPYYDEWMQPITERLVDGQLDVLVNYQQLKPQVGAML